MAARLAEAKRRIEQDEADLLAVLDSVAKIERAQARRDRTVAEADATLAEAMGRARMEAAPAVTAWRARGASEQDIATAAGIGIQDVRRLVKLAGDKAEVS
jgi:hypothetical protein